MAYDNSIVQKVTGTVHLDNNPLPISGTVYTSAVQARLPTMSFVSASSTPVLLVGSNINRKQLWIYNSGSSLRIGLGSVSTSSYFLKIESGGYWELPSAGSVYTGDVWGVWEVSVGGANVTEVR